MDARLAMVATAAGSTRDCAGLVIWITGLSGAGKTSTAREVVHVLRRAGEATVLLDGDDVRWAIADESVGYDPASRLKNAMRICRLAALLSAQGLTVVVATISLFREVHQWNRASFARYFEVVMNLSTERLRARDPQGLYRDAKGGTVRHVVGVDLEYCFPETPDLVFDDRSADRTPAELAGEIVRLVRAR